jgi:arylsulfatase A-like enzyme
MSRASQATPNVLLIVHDQERARHLIPEAVPLPQHDRLCADATVFRNTQTATNLCSMSRANLYTGRHAQRNGVWENTPLPFAGALRKDIPTVGHLFQEAGYATGYFGKWHMTAIDERNPPGLEFMQTLLASYGFEESHQDGERDGTQGGWRKDPETARHAVDFFGRHQDDDRPWFAAINFVNPHDIMFFMTSEHQRRTRIMDFPHPIAPAPDDPLYREDLGIDLPERFGPATLAGKPGAQREYQKVMELALGEIPFDDHDLWYAYQNYYWNCLRDVDRHLGAVLDGLEATGHADRTVVVLTADHGEMLGIHGLREKSGIPYREVSNVPLVIRHPDVAGPRETDALASLVDVLPTLLGFAGVDPVRLREEHPGLVGVDLSPALGPDASTDIGAAGREATLMQWTSLVHVAVAQARFFANMRQAKTDAERAAAGAPPDRTPYRGHMRGLFDGRYKFARYFSPREHHRPDTWDALVRNNDLELYDTLDDPGEINNLAADPEGQRARIEALNTALLTLVDREIGDDDGSYLPGATADWQLEA